LKNQIREYGKNCESIIKSQAAKIREKPSKGKQLHTKMNQKIKSSRKRNEIKSRECTVELLDVHEQRTSIQNQHCKLRTS
jgi:hypothetical protein